MDVAGARVLEHASRPAAGPIRGSNSSVTAHPIHRFGRVTAGRLRLARRARRRRVGPGLDDRDRPDPRHVPSTRCRYSPSRLAVPKRARSVLAARPVESTASWASVGPRLSARSPRYFVLRPHRPRGMTIRPFAGREFSCGSCGVGRWSRIGRRGLVCCRRRGGHGTGEDVGSPRGGAPAALGTPSAPPREHRPVGRTRPHPARRSGST